MELQWATHEMTVKERAKVPPGLSILAVKHWYPVSMPNKCNRDHSFSPSCSFTILIMMWCATKYSCLFPASLLSQMHILPLSCLAKGASNLLSSSLFAFIVNRSKKIWRKRAARAWRRAKREMVTKKKTERGQNRERDRESRREEGALIAWPTVWTVSLWSIWTLQRDATNQTSKMYETSTEQ